MKEGVVIQHGCGRNIFLSKKTLQDMCAIVCTGCGSLISLSLFGSKRKEQLLGYCKTYTEEKLKELLGEVKK